MAPALDAGVDVVTALDTARSVLDGVMDPEIPLLGIVDLGIVRDVRVNDRSVEVDITPTYSGCPAMEAIRAEIDHRLRSAGFDHVVVRTVFGEAWNTDWMTDRGRRVLLESEIAPPARSGSNDPVLCPRCSSRGIRTVSEFGSTACKALVACTACGEPFDLFKVVEP